MKTIKIHEVTHKELKVYCTLNGEKIEDVVQLAVVSELKKRKHSFINPKKLVDLNPYNKTPKMKK